MGHKIGFLIIFILFFFIISISCCAQTLKVYKYNARHPDESDESAGLISFHFYPDGLIKSYEESSSMQGSKPRQIIKAFKVIREGELIKQEYSKNIKNVFSNINFQVEKDAIFKSQTVLNENYKSKIHLQKVSASGEIVYNHRYDNKIIATFIFMRNENIIDSNIKVIKKDGSQYSFTEKYTYTVERTQDLPIIITKTPDNYEYDIKRTNAGITIITVKVGKGLPVMSYKITGPLKYSKPEVAIINYYLTHDDPGLASAIFPYIGGCPEKQGIKTLN